MKKNKSSNYCIDCQIKIGNTSKRCRKCSVLENAKLRKNSNTPLKEELHSLILNYSFVAIGKKFNVSDNTIRKWCKKYKLPNTKKELRSLISKGPLV